MKTCKTCAKSKAADCFYNGRAVCKECTSAARRKAYLADRESIAAANRERNTAYRERNRASVLERQREWAAANGERERARQRRRHAADPTAALTRLRRWREAHPEHAQALHRAHRENNRDAYRAKDAKRRAAKTGAATRWDEDLDSLAINEAFALAVLREKVLGGVWHVDHTVPLAAERASGLHNAYNLAVVPAAYNLSKGNKFHERMLTTTDWLSA